jgi:hypothetical protein
MEIGNQFKTLYHGTTEAHADKILAEGVRTHHRPESMEMAGPGFYTTPHADHAMTYAKSRAKESRGGGKMAKQAVVVEGRVDHPREYVMGRQEDEDLSEKPYVNGKSPDHVRNMELRSAGHNVLTTSHGDQTMSVVLRPKSFTPTRLHYPDGSKIDLGGN